MSSVYEKRLSEMRRSLESVTREELLTFRVALSEEQVFIRDELYSLAYDGSSEDLRKAILLARLHLEEAFAECILMADLAEIDQTKP